MDENENRDDDEIVMVPVPKKYLGRVYATLARSMSGETDDAGFPPDEPVTHDDPGPKPA